MDECRGRTEGAQLLPLNELKGRLGDLPQDKRVVTVCHAGTRSGQAIVILCQCGFTRVANMHGGMLMWHQLGLPVERT